MTPPAAASIAVVPEPEAPEAVAPPAAAVATEPLRPAARKRRLPERVQTILLGVGFPIALVVLWHELVVMTGTRLIPTPYQVGLMMYDFAVGGIHDDAFSGTILTHLLASMARVYGGLALAVGRGGPPGAV